jgi:hypothetical protein
MNKQEQAIEFASSMRGQYIISQALWLAIEKLNEQPENRREVSNISDMELLLDNLFPMFKAVQAAQQGTPVSPVDDLEEAIALLNDDEAYENETK